VQELEAPFGEHGATGSICLFFRSSAAFSVHQRFQINSSFFLVGIRLIPRPLRFFSNSAVQMIGLRLFLARVSDRQNWVNRLSFSGTDLLNKRERREPSRSDSVFLNACGETARASGLGTTRSTSTA
jgi:hypothetical protein